MKNYQKFLILIFVSVFFLSACATGSATENNDKKLAEKVIKDFHARYNEQKFEEIFNAAHEEARRTKSKEALWFALAEKFEKAGKYISSEPVFTKIEPVENSDERKVEMTFRSKFEKGDRNEAFLVITDGRTAALFALGEPTDDELEELK
jgi:hypothetical protein